MQVQWVNLDVQIRNGQLLWSNWLKAALEMERGPIRPKGERSGNHSPRLSYLDERVDRRAAVRRLPRRITSEPALLRAVDLEVEDHPPRRTPYDACMPDRVLVVLMQNLRLDERHRFTGHRRMLSRMGRVRG
jgi:hypothetical protein